MERSLLATLLVAGGALVVACAGGSDSVSSGSSSGGSSSGGSSGSSGPPSQCDAICMTGATLTFDESNAGGRLEGALVETCYRDRCAQGRLSAPDAGMAYKLTLTPTADAEQATVSAQVQPAGTADTLRFRIQWTLDFGSPAGVADGDVYTVSARTSPTGPELFTRSFTATYRDSRICGSSCKIYTTP